MNDNAAEIRRIKSRRHSYQRIFLTDEKGLKRDAQVVLADLKRFCRAMSSSICVSPVTGQVDPVATAAAEGRREVWLRIVAHLHLDDKTTINLEE